MSKKEKVSLRQQQAIIAEKKHQDSIRYMYFSRYLMVRYAVTALFFTNLFWLIFCFPYHDIALLGIIIAGIMVICSAVAAIEQLTKMHNRKLDVPVTRIYLWIQLGVNVLLIILGMTPIVKNVFPFVTTDNTKWLIESILLLGIVICLACEIRIRNINHGKDRYKKVIDTFKKGRQ